MFKLTGVNGKDIFIGENILTKYRIVELTELQNENTKLVLVTNTRSIMSFGGQDEHVTYLIKETPDQIIKMVDAKPISAKPVEVEKLDGYKVLATAIKFLQKKMSSSVGFQRSIYYCTIYMLNSVLINLSKSTDDTYDLKEEDGCICYSL